MITQAPINALKHKSDKEIINQIYRKFNRDLLSVINQNGNLYEIILVPSANFEKIASFVEEFASKMKGNDFTMIWLLQVGNDKKKVISTNSQFIVYQLKGKENYLIQMRSSDEIWVYQDYVYEGVLVKYRGEWFMYANDQLAEVLGDLIDHDENFERLGFRVQDYKKYGE